MMSKEEWQEWCKENYTKENMILTCNLTGLHARKEEFTSNGMYIKKYSNEFHKMKNYAWKKMGERFDVADYRLLKGFNVENQRTISQHHIWMLESYFKMKE